MMKVKKISTKPLCASFALTFKKPKDWEHVLKHLGKLEYFDFGVWAEEVGASGYRHIHFNAVFTVERRLNNKFFDEVLGLHPYLQRVERSPNDSRRLWQYYCKQSALQVISRSRDEVTLLEQIKSEVAVGLELGEGAHDLPLRIPRVSPRVRDLSPGRPDVIDSAVAQILADVRNETASKMIQSTKN